MSQRPLNASPVGDLPVGEPPGNPQPGGAAHAGHRDPRTPALQLRGISVGYDDTTVVRQVSLDIAAGEAVALLGANGSGKSTLVRGILSLADVSAGEVLLFGRPLTRADRHRIGYVPQRLSTAAPVPATVREVVMTGRLARRRWFVRPSRTDSAVVQRALELVQLADRGSTAVTELSGGQHRRALIARALAAEPEVLIMDEPTAGVDVGQQHAFAATLGRLRQEQVTMLLVTHELGPMLPVLTRAVVMDEGRLVHDGPVADVLAGQPDGAHRHAGGHHHDDHEARAAAGPLLRDLHVAPESQEI